MMLDFSRATASVAFLILGGLTALFLLRFGRPVAPLPILGAGGPEPSDADFWLTPYYLRYNTPVADDRLAILPQGSNFTYALGVPGSSIGARVLNLPGVVA